MKVCKCNLPEEFLQNMKELCGETEYEAYLESMEKPYYQGIRVNNAKISTEEFLKIAPFKLTPIPWTVNGFYVGKEEPVSKHPYYYAGLYYIQEPSAMVPASRIPVSSGDRILDLCAAPGGKSTELASRLNESGMLISNDISNSRAKALLKNLELFGTMNFCVCSEAPEKLKKFYAGYFDKILIDAPCSGEGMFRKDPSMLKSYEEHGPEYYRVIQAGILEEAVQMLKEDGYLLYSTCTFSVLENEENILELLKAHPEMETAEMEGYQAFSGGFAGKEEAKEYHLERCVRLFPHKLNGEGHFACLLHKKKSEAIPQEESIKQQKKSMLPVQWTDFVKETELVFPSGGSYKSVGESLYYISDDSAVKKAIRYLRTGLYLGDCKNKRFEPSQALAMYLKKEQVKQTLDLLCEDERVIRYLKGETLELTDTEAEVLDSGWVLICVSGYPLGWGKALNGTIRNKYYSGWRMN